MVSFEPDLSITDQSSFNFGTIELIPPVILIFAREHMPSNYSLLV